MPVYKLTYFNIRARGEPVRVMLKLAGVKYEERTLGFGSEEWKKERSGTLINNRNIIRRIRWLNVSCYNGLDPYCFKQ